VCLIVKKVLFLYAKMYFIIFYFGFGVKYDLERFFFFCQNHQTTLGNCVCVLGNLLSFRNLLHRVSLPLSLFTPLYSTSCVCVCVQCVSLPPLNKRVTHNRTTKRKTQAHVCTCIARCFRSITSCMIQTY